MATTAVSIQLNGGEYTDKYMRTRCGPPIRNTSLSGPDERENEQDGRGSNGWVWTRRFTSRSDSLKV